MLLTSLIVKITELFLAIKPYLYRSGWMVLELFIIFHLNISPDIFQFSLIGDVKLVGVPNLLIKIIIFYENLA